MARSLALGLTAALWMTAAAAEPIRVAVCECDSAPLLELGPDRKPSGGIIKDLVELIAAKLGQPVEYKVLSRKRIDPALERGDADLVCFTSPNWTRLADRMHWTGENLVQTELFLMHRNWAFQIESLDDLKGKTLGLILGFHYPGIDPQVERGDMRASRQTDHVQNFRLLERQRIDVAVSTDLQIAHYLRQNPKARSVLMVSDFVLSRTPTQCAVPKASRLDPEPVRRAVKALGEQGAFERLMKTYREPLL
ncbi:substrate-binding periplasmic protein [Chitinimonas lacunae]|uniref:Substrate-binding periplasmic protein n=1 Tax=Chitinimonas lacunae TaxID=1963018 RepID=A0ABV8MXH5_9NEIS